jgi:hypothetical protein
MSRPAPIRPKDRDAIVQSLRAGVVPRVGQQHIQVGRVKEIEALLRDIDRVADGGAAFRLVVGEYGSGKTFFLNLIGAIGLERKLVVATADLNPDRRFHATGGQARSLYAELMKNIATRTKPEGGALTAIVERFVSEAVQEAKKRGVAPDVVIDERLAALHELVGGFDFAQVIGAYWRGHEEGSEELKTNAVRWLRAEFTTKTDAKAALGVRTIIDDANGYDFLKLFARFVRLAGFGGFLVCFDELVNLYKLANTQARTANYEQVLRILNDALQGSSVGLGILMGGTPEFLFDPRRGLYSYQALQSRLAENSFARGGLVDYSGPVLRLSNLTQEDFFVLLEKLRHVYAGGDPAKYLLPDPALPAFMTHCAKRIGDAYFRTPRTTISAFLGLLAVLEQNPGANWQELLGALDVAQDHGAQADAAEEDADGPTAAAPAAPAATKATGPAASGDDDDLATFKM